jgi:hypothetical protein
MKKMKKRVKEWASEGRKELQVGTTGIMMS